MKSSNLVQITDLQKSIEDSLNKLKIKDKGKKFIHYNAKSTEGQKYTVIIAFQDAKIYSVLAFPEIKENQETINTFPVIIDLSKDYKICGIEIFTDARQFLFDNGSLIGIASFIYRQPKNGTIDSKLLSSNYLTLLENLDSSLKNLSLEIPKDFEDTVIENLKNLMEGEKYGNWFVGYSKSNYAGLYLGIGNDKHQFRLSVQTTEEGGKELFYLRYEKDGNKASVERSTYISNPNRIDILQLYRSLKNVSEEYNIPYSSKEYDFDGMKERSNVASYQGYQGFENTNKEPKERVAEEMKNTQHSQQPKPDAKDEQINSSNINLTKGNVEGDPKTKKSGGLRSFFCCSSTKKNKSRLDTDNNGKGSTVVNNDKGFGQISNRK